MISCVLSALFFDLNLGRAASFNLPSSRVKTQPPQLTEHKSVVSGFLWLFSLRNQE